MELEKGIEVITLTEHDDEDDEIIKVAQLSVEDALKELNTEQAGLTIDEVHTLQQTYGKNIFAKAKQEPLWKKFIANFTSLMAILLWVAGIIAFCANLVQLGIAIWAVNIINGIFSFWQEFQADKATEALANMLPSYTRVVRNGKEEKILAKDLVPGDIVKLEEGDDIPADIRVIAATSAQVDQSSLTGEVNPVHKDAHRIENVEKKTHADLNNMIFSGTNMMKGNVTGAVVKTAFCGPCFGAGDTPANNALSIRHSTRNFPNREGSKVQNGQISSVALMDARSIAATAANKGYLTAATDFDVKYTKPRYFFDKTIYENRVFDSKGIADPETEIQFGPNIKDWPEMPALTENLVLKVVSEIHDPVTTTDELIPSGETSSFRSNPLGLAEFALSRKDPEYVPLAKEIQAAEKAREAGNCPLEAVPELKAVWDKLKKLCPDMDSSNTGIGSTIFAVKPGDGSAREQAASCQKVLGGWANIANEYATKRYRSNLINWGMLPLLMEAADMPFKKGDYLFLPGIRKAVEEKAEEIKVYVAGDSCSEFTVKIGDLTDDEREIILKGCLINYYRG